MQMFQSRAVERSTSFALVEWLGSLPGALFLAERHLSGLTAIPYEVCERRTGGSCGVYPADSALQAIDLYREDDPGAPAVADLIAYASDLEA